MAGGGHREAVVEVGAERRHTVVGQCRLDPLQVDPQPVHLDETAAAPDHFVQPVGAQTGDYSLKLLVLLFIHYDGSRHRSPRMDRRTGAFWHAPLKSHAPGKSLKESQFLRGLLRRGSDGVWFL